MLDLILDTTIFGFVMMLVLIVVSPIREFLLNLELEEYFDGGTTGISYNVIHLLLFMLWLMIPGLNLVLLMLLNIMVLSIIMLAGVNILRKVLKIDIEATDSWLVFVIIFVLVAIITPLIIVCNCIQPTVDKLFRSVKDI